MGPYPNCYCKKTESDGSVNPLAEASRDDEFQVAADFEELNKRCADHAFARDFAKELKIRCASALQRTKDGTKLSRLTLIHDACKLLMEARQVLTHTCVLEFYMKPSPERRLFDFMMKDLEKQTDAMQEVVENLSSKQHAADRLKTAQLQSLRTRVRQFLAAADRNFALREESADAPVDIINQPIRGVRHNFGAR